MNEQIDLSELIVDLNSTEELIRATAYTVLVEQGAEAATELVGMFPQISRPARLHVIRALGEIGHPVASPLLSDLVRTEDPQEYLFVSSLAAKALGQIGDVDALLALLADERGGPRRMAATVLGNMAHPAAVPHLKHALRHEDPPMQKIAAKALGRIGTPEAIAAVDAWRTGRGRETKTATL